MTTRAMTTEEHARTAREFLAAAEREFADGDDLQASEKLWGAASHAVKAIAIQRHWPHGTHRAIVEAVKSLAEEQGDETLRWQFGLAEKFHANFYTGFMEDFTIAYDRTVVDRFVRRALSIAEA